MAPIAHSAIGSSNTPRALVTATSLATRAGNKSPSTPSLADWIHRSVGARSNASSIQARWACQKKSASASAIAVARVAASGAYRTSASAAAGSMPGGGLSGVAPETTTTGPLTGAAAR